MIYNKLERTYINPSDSVEIGDNLGIGGVVMIWTDGAWLDVLQGFPSDFGPVKIGKNVWLPARSIVLPNVTIGDNTVIGIGSIINRNLPGGCFAAGSPCKVIKENCYPVKLTDSEKGDIINGILSDWNYLIKHKHWRPFEHSYLSLEIETSKAIGIQLIRHRSFTFQ